MAGKRRVWHIIRDSQKTLCCCLWYPGDKVLTEEETKGLGPDMDWCRTCKMTFMRRHGLSSPIQKAGKE